MADLTEQQRKRLLAYAAEAAEKQKNAPVKPVPAKPATPPKTTETTAIATKPSKMKGLSRVDEEVAAAVSGRSTTRADEESPAARRLRLRLKKASNT